MRPILLACVLVAGCGGNDGAQDVSDAGAPPPPRQQEGGAGPAPAHTTNDAGSSAHVPPVDDPVQPGVLVRNPRDAFSGAPPYSSALPKVRANDQHTAPVTGKPCLSCHDGTTCLKFDFGGTIWKGPAVTEPAPRVEVRIIDANNYAYSVYSDEDGNFWHRADGDLAMPALSGVRVATQFFVGHLNGTSCNGCHEQGTPLNPGRLFIDEP